MLWISGIFFVIIIVSYLVGFLVSAPKYKGSVSDHFNGSTFVNPGNVQAKGLKDVIRWAMNREKEPWMEELNAPVGPKPANKVDDSIKVTFRVDSRRTGCLSGSPGRMPVFREHPHGTPL